MAGSVSASLRRRKKDKENKNNEHKDPFEALQKRAEIEAKISNSSLNMRPQTSYGVRTSPVKKVSTSNMNQKTSAEDFIYNNMESQISTVEDETDRLLKELQDWRLQHSK